MQEKIWKLIEERFEELTEIQKLAIPVILKGVNALIIAPTGYGKTEAALLPVFEKILNEKEEGIICLYITPLRALNRDLIERITWWCERLDISIAVRHGDTPISERAKQLRAPPKLMITTPETLQILLCAKKMSEKLKSVKWVIVDEVHELCDNKRGAQLSVGLERLREKCGNFQLIGLSATVGSPSIVGGFLCGKRNYEIVKLPKEREMSIRIEYPVPNDKDKLLSKSLFLEESAISRLRVMKELIETHTRTLLFVNTRVAAEAISSRLLALGVKIGVHHGSLSRDVRIDVERKFKKGEIKGLIATSSLELGIDIGEVDLAIQYLSPRQVVRIVQRVGRSGHGVGKLPKGIIITCDIDDLLEGMVIAKEAKEMNLEEVSVEKNAYDVIAHQLAGIVLNKGSVLLEEAHKLISSAFPFSSISLEEIESIAEQLQSEGLLWYNKDEKKLGKNRNTIVYYYENVSMIPSEKKFFVRNTLTNSIISSLDEGFVANYLQPHTVFITKGVPWKVLDIFKNEVLVEPSEDMRAGIPDWVGEEIPVPFEIAQGVGKLRKELLEGEGDVSEIAFLYNVPVECVQRAHCFLRKQSILPNENDILIEGCEDVVVIHICGGTKVNQTLGRLLCIFIISKIGESVRFFSDPYRIIFHFPYPIKPEFIREIFFEIKDVKKALELNIPSSSLFRYKFLHVARAFGLIAKDSEPVNMSKVIERLVGSPIYKETLRDIFHNYLDVERCEWIIKEFQKGNIKLNVVSVSEPSPLARVGLLKIASIAELIAPIEPYSEILKAFKTEILSERIQLLCAYCKKIFYRELRKIEGEIICEGCGGRLIGVVDRETLEILKRKGPGYNKRIQSFLRSASLVEAYGKRALIALSVYGVGCETAARILQKLHSNEELLFRDLLEAQKRFIRTKRYWKV